MSILKVISARLDTMSEADRAIGRFIVKHPERMLQLSSAALAAETGHSQSSVVKFSQKLGYAGYQDLKLAVNKAQAQTWHMPPGMIHGSIESSDSYLTIQQKLVSSKILSVQETVAINGAEAIDRVLDALIAAGRIHLAGVGASSLVARDFSYKLLKLGRMVLFDSDSHVQIANAATLEREDVLFAISHSGASLETLRVAERARARRAKVISVTGLKPNPLAEVADLHLYTVADEERVRSSAITSRDAQLALTDLLFILLVRRQPGASDSIHRCEAAAAVLKA
jgi:DNA-binding MurR/RpiR family transcriptional regulator